MRAWAAKLSIGCWLAQSLVGIAWADAAARALSLAQNGKCEEALPELRSTVARSPGSVKFQNAIGVCEAQLGHASQAAASFEVVAKLQPAAWQAWNNLGASYLTLNRVADAESAFDRAVKLNPKATSAWFNLGSSLWKQGKQVEGFKAVDRARQLSPQDAQLTRAWADTASQIASEAAHQIDEGRYGGAAKLLYIVQQPLEKTASWNDLAGYAEFKLGHSEEAREHLQKAIELDPNNEDYLLDIGEFLASRKAYDQAARFFEVGIKRMPDAPRVRFGLAVTEILQDRRAEATSQLEELLRHYPRFEPVYNALGECYEDAGNWPVMDDLGRKLASIDPSNAVGWYLQGASTEQLAIAHDKDITPAITFLKKAADLDPRSSRYHFRLGKAYEETHQTQAALHELKEAIRIEPGHERAHYVLARLYRSLGENDLARREFQAHARIKANGRQEAYAAMLAGVRRTQNPPHEQGN
ncbi:MAG: tetratricopeptide repeat protein [Bryobacteraceae bacterium]